jgi:hypothetical protein
MEIDNHTRVDFYNKEDLVFTRIMSNDEIVKIPYNDIIIIKKVVYRTYSRQYNIDDDVLFIMMELQENFHQRHIERMIG